MKSLSLSEAEAQFESIVQAAKFSTVTLTENGKPAIVMGPAGLAAQRKARAWDRLENVMQETGKYAAAQGLTDDILDALLADES